MTDTPIEDANACMMALHDLLERVTNPDVAIHCLTLILGRQIADDATDRADAAERVAKAAELIEERVMTNLDVCAWALKQRGEHHH